MAVVERVTGTEEVELGRPQRLQRIPGPLLTTLQLDEASAQVYDYERDRDGLAQHLPDHTWRPKRKRRWSHKQNRPILGQVGGMSSPTWTSYRLSRPS